MRAQVSFEFLIYIIISAISLVFIIAAYLKGSVLLSNANVGSSVEELVSVINMNTGYQQASFVAYIPNEICNAQINEKGVRLANMSYYFIEPTRLDKAELCSYAGEIVTLKMSESPNSTFSVEVTGD